MARFLLASLLIVASLAFLIEVEGKDFGKLTCSGTKKKHSLSLITAFVTAKCPLPLDGKEESFGKVTRCVFEYLDVFKAPSTFNQAKANEQMAPVFPTDYQDGFKKAMASCIKSHSKKCKSASDDGSGKTWIAMYKCFLAWYDDKLCKK